MSAPCHWMTTNMQNEKEKFDIVQFAVEKLSMCIGEDDQVYVQLPNEHGLLTRSIEDARVESWLAHAAYTAEKQYLTSAQLKAILRVLTHMAQTAGNRRAVFHRFGKLGDDYYIDLGHPDGTVIEIGDAGWKVTRTAACQFMRTPEMRPLAYPDSLMRSPLDPKELLRFVNISSPKDQMLFLVACCAMPLVDIARPILGFVGPEGSAKSTASSVVRRLWDHNDPIFSDFTGKKDDLALIFKHNPLPVFDNLSKIPISVSDMFCKAVTGAGFQKRTLYTNFGVSSLSYRRSFLFTGLDLPSAQPDLLDRCIIFRMDPIPPSERKPEQTVLEEFNDCAPSILAGMLEALVKAVYAEEEVIREHGRLADFTRIGAAIARELGYSSSSFVEAFLEKTRRQKGEAAMDGEPIAEAIVELVEDIGGFTGSPTRLLQQLEPYRRPSTKSWPDSPVKLGKALARLKEALSIAGIEVSTDGRNRDGKVISLQKLEDASERSDAASVSVWSGEIIEDEIEDEDIGKELYATERIDDETVCCIDCVHMYYEGWECSLHCRQKHDITEKELNVPRKCSEFNSKDKYMEPVF